MVSSKPPETATEVSQYTVVCLSLFHVDMPQAIQGIHFFSFADADYLVEAPSCRIFLAGSELLQLSIQDVHQLLHQTDRGADVPGEDGAFGVPG